MKIWHISDTHGFHRDLSVPKADMVIHSGDFANSRNSSINSNEALDFLDWFAGVEIKNKILIAGNHDISVENRMIHPKFIQDSGIHYLENSCITIENLKIWGSPITPSFGTGWAFNRARHKMSVVWEQIPKDADIIVTHGPPKGMLDMNQEFEMCGCKSLLVAVSKIKPIFSLFGHVHSNEKVNNSGIRKIASLNTIFSNGSVVNDGKMLVVNNGNVLAL
jgi:Icc-related predicted phosphoesterase